VHDLLTAAATQLEAGATEVGLNSLLQAWRTKRVPALADLVDLVSALPLPRKWIEAETLLNVLYDWPADPRFSRFLAQFVLSNAVYSRIGENRANQVPGFYHRVLRRLVQLGETRVLPMLADVRHKESDVSGSWRSGVGEALAPLKAPESSTLTTDELGLNDALRGRFASQTSERKDSSTTVADLYEQVCQNPHDDGLRAVLADQLTERGQVRGEFITLQLQPRRDLTKELKLLEKFSSAFAGPLDGYFHRARRVFERGFLAGGELAGVQLESLRPEDLEEVSWRLITTLDLPLRFDTSSLTHPNLAFVRKLEVTEASLVPMLKREWPLTELFISHWGDDRSPLPHPLLDAAQFPALKVLGVHVIPDASAVTCRQWLPKAPVLQRLEQVVLDIYATEFGPWWPELTKSPIPAVQVGRAPGWVFTFTRDERGELGALHARHDPRDGVAVSTQWNAATIEFWMDALLTGLLPEALTSLTIEPSTTAKKLRRTTLQQTLTRFPLLTRVTLPFD